MNYSLDVDIYLPASEAGLEIRPPPICSQTIRQMFDKGKLRGMRTPGSMRLIPRGEIERVNKERLEKAAARAARKNAKAAEAEAAKASE
jgi:hypothetical protein